MWGNVIKSIVTGCGCIDSKMEGGISPGSITLIYGEAEAGKTTLAMQCAVNCAMQNYKTLFMDCDNTFSAKRLSQVASGKFAEIQRVVNSVLLYNIMSLVAGEDNASQVRALAFMKLEELKKQLHSAKGPAINALEHALELGYRDFKWLRRDPDLKNIRRHPRYKRIRERIRVLEMETR